jgi:ElaB/YqjD/DUF883 family membrane-anchored ribosome-binding protein
MSVKNRDIVVEEQPMTVTATMPAAVTAVRPRHISWAAVFAGVVVVLLSQTLFSLLGLAIGASTVDPLREQNPFGGLGVGAALWLVVSTLLSLYFGGWVAGRLAGIPDVIDGMLHGVLTCGLATLLTVYLVSSAVGAVARGTASAVGGVASAASRGAMAAGQEAANMNAPQVVTDRIKEELKANGIDVDAMQRNAEQVLSPDPKPGLSQEDIRRQTEQIRAIVKRTYDRGELNQADKDELSTILAARTGKSRDEVTETVNKFEADFRQARQKIEEAKRVAEQKIREVGDKAATVVARGSGWSFLALLLGIVAAAFGGRMAAEGYSGRSVFGPRVTGPNGRVG